MRLEVIATSLEDGLEAEAGGADRLEVVRELERGGLTPPLALVEALLARVRVPLRVMVRVEEPFVPTGPEVVDRMCAEARALAGLPLHGVVFGVLTRDHAVDLDALSRFADAAAPLPMTFHRAFELAPDPGAALRVLSAAAPVDRVLTSAGEGTAAARVGRLRAWREASPGRPSLLFAAGLDPDAIREAAANGFEVHVGRAARADHRVDRPVTAEMVTAVRNLSRTR